MDLYTATYLPSHTPFTIKLKKKKPNILLSKENGRIVIYHLDLRWTRWVLLTDTHVYR